MQPITRRSFSAALVAGAALSMFPAAGRAADIVKAKNVVLVHGAYADASCWLDVIPHLQAAGLNVMAVQNPLTSFADDVEATKRILALMDGPTVLVGHSYSGMLVTEAGVDPKVTALVYIALMPARIIPRSPSSIRRRLQAQASFTTAVMPS